MKERLILKAELSTELLDVVLLNDYLSRLGIDIIVNMYALYIRQSAIYLKDIEKALELKDSVLWQEHCHKMKGAASSVGLKSLYFLLSSIEETNETMEERELMYKNLVIKNNNDSLLLQKWIKQQQ